MALPSIAAESFLQEYIVAEGFENYSKCSSAGPPGIAWCACVTRVYNVHKRSRHRSRKALACVPLV